MSQKDGFQKHVLTLKSGASWKAPEGYNVFVADRGAVRFNVPKDWVATPAADCVEIYDKPSPEDNCRLAVSYLRLPVPEIKIDWSGLPLTQLITEAARDSSREILSRGEIVTVPREDIELAWMEMRFIDPTEHREAFTRLAMARGKNLQALITYDFWVEDAARFSPVWDEVMRSVELGRYVDDPAAGDVLE